MKKRIQIDSSLLSLVVLFTGVLFFFRKFYPSVRVIDNLLDVLGCIAILKGVMLRMIARGHKKAFSGKGNHLVTTGIYSYTRNPMYLGTFYISMGFLLMVWPWWCLPLFAWAFYARFVRQVRKEEAHLSKMFPEEYAEYCRKTPRVFPSIKKILKARAKDLLNWKEAFSTTEKRNLVWCPLAAVMLETIQEIVVYGQTDIRQTLSIVFVSAVVYGVGLWVFYQR